MECHKASLVAKDFHQYASEDFNKTFSLIIKPTIIQTILILVVSYGWYMHQIVENNTFLHGDLIETMYMAQTPGFMDHSHPTHVCQFQKVWTKISASCLVQYLSTFLIQLGFMRCYACHLLFIYRSGLAIMLLLLHVNDIILTGNQPFQLPSFVHTHGKV